MSHLLQIGELAKQTRLSIRTLRYYDEIGLLVPSHRTEAEYRLYSEAELLDSSKSCRCGSWALR
ncbi:MAG: MerR family DNA-binding transcriptional regulator [Elainellaceae cyanobacterium]